MPRPATAPRRVGFVEHIAVSGRAGAFGEALQQLRRRLERRAAGMDATVRVTSVRRMAEPEVARVRLEPTTSAWFEVRGDLAPLSPRPVAVQAPEGVPDPA